ncbi:Ribosome-releasing factor 2 mitochondrial [Bienertia sinuspersici]
MATIELEKHEWAYWDLYLAAEINPKNQEVTKKLEEVTNFIKMKKSKNPNQGDCPKGLGIGLSPPLKKSDYKLKKTQPLIQTESKDTDPTIIDEKKKINGEHVAWLNKDADKDPSEFGFKKPVGYTEVSNPREIREEKIEEFKGERM